MPRKPLVTDDTDYEPPTAQAAVTMPSVAAREPVGPPQERPVMAGNREVDGKTMTVNYDGEQGEHEGRELQPPVQPSEPVREQPTSRLRRGWSAANNQVEKASGYAQAFKPEENVTYVIKFLEDGPYASFQRHWIDRPSQKGGVVPVPFTCLRSEGINKPCPLCDVLGDAPKVYTSFNIAVVERAGDVSLRSFDTTAAMFKVVQNFARDPLYTPITAKWWAAKKTKDARGYNTIGLTPIMSDASLHDDYKYTVPSEDDLAAIELYEPDIVQVRSTSELMEIAKEQAAQDEYDPYGDG